jgi:phosphoglycolate phosphatase
MKAPEKEVSGLIFDFDYTLVDSSEHIFDCANAIMAQMGLAPVSRAQVLTVVADTLENSYRKLTGDDSPVAAAEYCDRLRAYQRTLSENKVAFFGGIHDRLEALANANIPLGIVSSNESRNIINFLKRHDALEMFSSIVSACDVSAFKPHPQGLFQCLKQMSLTQSGVYYFGDSVHDAGAAKEAGVDFVGLLTGHATEQCFQAFPFISLHDHPADAIDAVDAKHGLIIKK